MLLNQKQSKVFNRLVSAMLIIILLLIGLARITNFDLNRLPFAIRVVESGSMKPELPIGSLIVTRQVAPSQVKSGNVISFAVGNTVFTHRVLSVAKKDNSLKFRTKGDNSPTADPTLIADSDVLGKLVLMIPYLGYIFLFFQRPAGWLFTICIIGGLWMIYQILILLKKERKHEKASPE